ncbi:hypothetical protein [Prochlorococcus marinus]|uniref:hypothetical protein n=1 Tax=Prochlorococcus marinus TaxID=1219 RepID=UPI000517698A|nr:hypothetical protein [Prochlorococcus marinus]
MKLFKSLLVTSAFLALLAPITATASEINIDEMNSYVRKKSSSKKQFNSQSFSKDIVKINESVERIDSGINEFEAGSFSETTTMSGTASYQIGGVTGSEITEAITSTYSIKTDLNTSFTGEDNLYVGIETGNSSALNDFDLESSVVGGDNLNVASMYYQFPLGEFQIAVGPELDSDDLMPTKTSAYSDKFFFESQYGLKSNFFASRGTGAGVAVARTFDGGLNASASIIGTGASTNSGILTAEGIDVSTLSLGYDADNFGGGIIFQNSDSICTLVNDFIVELCNDYGISAILDEGYSATTIGGYYSPDEKLKFSITSSFLDPSISGTRIDTIQDFQFAVDREWGDGTLHASYKTYPFYKVPDLNGDRIQQDDLGSFVEVYYTYNVNDSLTLRPGVSITMPIQDADDIAAGNDDLAFSLIERTAIGVGATFKF